MEINKLDKIYQNVASDQIRDLVCTSGNVNIPLWKALFGQVPYEQLHTNKFYDGTLVLLTTAARQVSFLTRNNAHGFGGSALSGLKVGKLDISVLDQNNLIQYWAREHYDETDFRPFTLGRLEGEAKEYARDIVLHSNKAAVVLSEKRGLRKFDELDVYLPTSTRGEVIVQNIPLHPHTVEHCKLTGKIVIPKE